MRSQHFRVRANVDSAEATEATRKLELLRHAMLYAWGGGFDAPGTFEVILLASPVQLGEFTKAGGFAMMSGEASLLVMPVPRHIDEEGTSTAAHELAHRMMASAVAGVPRWFGEGLATYLETIEVSDDGRAVMGRPHEGALGQLSEETLLSLDALWQWGKDGSATLSAQHYASSWLWVHFLLNRYPRELSRFQEALARGMSAEQSFDEAFASHNLSKIAQQIRNYLHHSNMLMAAKLDVPRLTHKSTVRPMSEAEVHVTRAQLLRVSPISPQSKDDRKALVAAELSQANALDPNEITLMYLRLQEMPNGPERVTAARDMVKRHPNDPDAWFTLSSLLDDPAEREATLLQAIAVDPTRPSAIHALALLRAQQGNTQEAHRLSKQAADLAPWRGDFLITHALLLAEQRYCQDAKDTAVRAFSALSERTPEAVMRKVAEQLEPALTCQVSRQPHAP